MGYFTDKKVLITGGTGTIGKQLLKTILLDRPAVVRILSRDEFKQFELHEELRDFTNIRYLIGDVRDCNRLERAMEDIDYVFHTASMKHVPACEYNPFEAVQTNVIGSQNVIQAAIQAGVKKTVFTSTDKAISPTNTYGASKLMAERLFTAAQMQTGPRSTVFSAVRFGNVMGSRGSVIPLFKWQIENRREITVTDKAMSRFMMTLSQATHLTIEAMKRSVGGETFVLKMPVVRLKDLAEVLVENYAESYGIAKEEIVIREIGLRPGEKMYEELMTEEEAKYALEYEDMYVLPNQFLRNSQPQYEGASALGGQSYRSNLQHPVSREQLIDMLTEERLLFDRRIPLG